MVRLICKEKPQNNVMYPVLVFCVDYESNEQRAISLFQAGTLGTGAALIQNKKRGVMRVLPLLPLSLFLPLSLLFHFSHPYPVS